MDSSTTRADPIADLMNRVFGDAQVPDVRHDVPERLQSLAARSEYWATALSMEQDRLRNLQRWYGYPVVAITAVTGLAIFTQLESQPERWAKFLVASVSILAAVLAAVQTQQNFAVRATEAGGASSEFGTLYGDMLNMEDRLRRGDDVPVDDITKLYTNYEDLKKRRPAVSDRVGDRASRRIARDALIEKTRAEARTQARQ